MALGIAGSSLPGCATPPSQPDSPSPAPSESVLLPARASEVWTAAKDLLISAEVPLRTEDRSRGILRTGWVEGWTDRPFGFGLTEATWRRRFQLTVWIREEGHDTRVGVRARVEEKAPGGRLALRWRRVPSDGEPERDFLKRLREQLNLPGGPGR